MLFTPRSGRNSPAKRTILSTTFLASVALGIAQSGHAQPPPKHAHPTDLSQGNNLYLVGYAHLDTQWRWSYPQVIREFIANTMHNNFRLFAKYPDYVFNFSGSRRYEMMKEYYPADYALVKKYVASGQWFPCGSSVDECDANVPSAESLIRQTLYGNHFFRREFGVASQEFMLPDCFGFPYALPTILSHCGIKAFSTQKLTWGSANGIPFKVGTWEGPDGKSVVAALDPGSYSAGINEDLSQNTSWLARIQNTGKQSGAYVDYHYYGTGDRGGAPDEDSVKWMERSVAGTGPVRVISSKSDEMVKALTPEQITRLPHYKGELLLTQHSAGSISSESYMKRWNRKNELLADDAERASLAAGFLGGAPYPSVRMYNAWDLVLGSQMHDMLPGTSLPQAYQYCWNDETLALNQFGAITQDGIGVVAEAMNTSARGIPLVVYNPLSIARQDVAKATLNYPGKAPVGVQVYGPNGAPVPTQIVSRTPNSLHIIFLASLPPVGSGSFDVRPVDSQATSTGDLRVHGQTLENARFIVKINDAGDIGSIYDKAAKREVLESPTRLAMQYENPSQYPAWNMDWADAEKPPREYVVGPAKIRVVESGPVRVAIEVERETHGSKFVQRIRLASGSAGDRIEIANTIDWNTRETALKASFPLAAGNPMATYDLQVGAIQRGNNEPKKYEVPQHQWFYLTAPDGKYGVGILNDSKFGSDKPDDNTVRLTLIYTPGTRAGYADQGTQDIGRHNILYAIAPHIGDWRQGDVAWQAKRLNQPLLTFRVTPHAGAIGKTFSLATLNTKQVQLSAMKKAEDSDEIVVRMRELYGKPAQHVKLTLAGRIISAREINGQELPLGPAKIVDGSLITNVPAYSLRAFALRIQRPRLHVLPTRSHSIALPFNLASVSTVSNLTAGAFDSRGWTYPAEQFPASIASDGLIFKMGPKTDGAKNAVSAHGQVIPLEPGTKKVYLLASSSEGDVSAQFKVGQQPVQKTVESWGGFVGQWDTRQWIGIVPELTYDWHNELGGLTHGYIKPGEVAWWVSHKHSPARGNEFYDYSYIYKLSFNVPAGVRTITLPNDPRVKIFAATEVSTPHDIATAAAPLSDTLHNHLVNSAPIITPPAGHFADATLVSMSHPLYWQTGCLHYTTDGSTPTATSPVYTHPIELDKRTVLKTAEIDGADQYTVNTSVMDVNDVTPPSVTSAVSLMGLPSATVTFSEPVDPVTAQNIANYSLSGGIGVKSAALAEDRKSVKLTLDQGLTDSDKLSLTVSNIKDMSPNANTLTSTTVDMASGGLAFSSPALKDHTSQHFDVADLPVNAGEPWTLNLFCKMDSQPDNRTLIAGFGKAEDGTSGIGRYFSKFANGIHFWIADRDVDTDVPFDLGKWQMITASYDGATIRLYKNGVKIAEQKTEMASDSPEVNVMPIDPWDRERTFSGSVRNVTIWKQSLVPADIQQLWLNGKTQ